MKIAYFFVVLVHFHGFKSSLADDQSPLYLRIGEQRSVSLPEVRKYSMSGTGFRYSRAPGRNEILIKATQAGRGALWFQLKSGQTETKVIQVLESKTMVSPPMGLVSLINGLRSLEVLERGNVWLIRGVIPNREEAARFAAIRNQYGNLIIDETAVDPQWATDAIEAVNQQIKNHSGIQLRNHEGELWVTGSLAHVSMAQALQKSLSRIYPLLNFDIVAAKDRDPTIYFKVYLLEVQRDEIQTLGIQWPGTAPGQFRWAPLDLNLSNSPLELTLNALNQKGSLQILSAPELVVRAPGKAEIFAGGELPIRQRSAFNEQVIWKTIGLQLKLEVQSLHGQQVRLNIETSLSHLDIQLANDDVPGIKSNHIRTQVDASLSKALLLSGLLQEGLREQVSGIPGLANLPVLGKLFSSTSFQKNKSELVAILLPYLSPPPNPQKRVKNTTPLGFIPLDRSPVDSAELEMLKKSELFPWSAL